MTSTTLPLPADLARMALRRLGELKLPPTPELYARYYYEALGTSAPVPQPGQVDPELASRIDEIVRNAATVTENLSTSVSACGDEVATTLESLVADESTTGAVGLLRTLFASTSAMHETLRASHSELLQARQSLAVIEAELNESRKLLERDPLTGTENRQVMSSILEREMARSRRDKEPMTVAMIDIDHFKKINDTHGHAAGDAALVHLTQLARAILRGNDAFIRYGGEEFVLVLAETASAGAVHVAGRLMQALAKQPFVHHGQAIPMTFSAGVASLQDEDTQAKLLDRADKAMYAAKRAGRNRVHVGD